MKHKSKTRKIARDCWQPQTKMIHSGKTRSNFAETSEALFLSSGFTFDTAEQAKDAFLGNNSHYIYSRYGNPSVTMFQERMATIENATYCIATASGMAAVFGILASLVKAGDRIVASQALFGSCHYILKNIFPKFGVDINFVDGTNYNAWFTALKKPTKCIFLETPSNPTLELINLKLISELAHKSNAMVIVDNVLASPILQQPLNLGADVVVYSATKHIDGQGRTLGGAVLTNNKLFFEESLVPFLRHTGPALSPFNSWVLLKGLETLKVRVDQQSLNALSLAQFLQHHPKIIRVCYPSLPSHPQYNIAREQMSAGGTVITFEVGKTEGSAFCFLNALKLIKISNNIGDVKSLITHPSTTTHKIIGEAGRKQLGITDSMVRLSVGLEDTLDLQNDLEAALEEA